MCNNILTFQQCHLDNPSAGPEFHSSSKDRAMAPWPSPGPEGDGTGPQNGGDDVDDEPLTGSVIGQGNEEDNDVSENKKIERGATEADEVPQPLFGRWVVLACAISNFALGLSLPLATSTMFIEWQDTFKVNRAHTVTVHSTAIGLLFGAAIIPGYLMDRFGARFTVLLGCFLSSFGCLISIFATSINYLIASVGILGGFGFCFIQLPSIPCVCHVFPRHGGIVVSVCTFGSAILNMSMPYLYRYLINTFGWRGSFAFITAFSMQTAVLGLIMTSRLKTPRQKVHSLGDDIKNELHNSLLQESKESSVKVIATEEEDFPKQMCMSGEKIESFGEVNEAVPCSGNNLQVNRSKSDRISALERLGSLVSPILNSKWEFLFDGMYLLIMFHIATCLAVQFSFAVIIMDFARTKGFPDDSTGTFFLLVIYLSSLIGRLLVGILNLVPFLHSMIIMGIYGVMSSFGMIMLGSATNYTNIVVFFVFQGFGVGGIVSIYPKGLLDTDRVNLKNYSLALGLSCTWEGIFDFLVPILIGHVVDSQGSYTMILRLLGSISLTSSIIIIVIKLYFGNHTCRRSKSDAKNSS